MKNTDENDIKPTVICECHCHTPKMKCRLGKHCEYYGKKCSHCHPEKQGDDWESRKSVDELKPFMPDAFNGDLGLEVAFKEGYNCAVRQVEKQTRESVIEEVKHHIRNWTDYDIGLMKWIDQLKQKTKE